MKFSELIKALYEASTDVSSVADLAECTGINKGFIDRLFAGKNTTEKIDVVFEYLTNDLHVEEVIEAIELIRTIRFLQERRRNSENAIPIDLEAAKKMTEKEREEYLQSIFDRAQAKK